MGEKGIAEKLTTRHPCAGTWWQLPMEEHTRGSLSDAGVSSDW